MTGFDRLWPAVTGCDRQAATGSDRLRQAGTDGVSMRRTLEDILRAAEMETEKQR